jgi:hypothetical protein
MLRPADLTACGSLQAMSAAAVDDVVAWCVLAVSSSFAKAGSPVNGLYTVRAAGRPAGTAAVHSSEPEPRYDLHTATHPLK